MTLDNVINNICTENEIEWLGFKSQIASAVNNIVNLMEIAFKNVENLEINPHHLNYIPILMTSFPIPMQRPNPRPTNQCEMSQAADSNPPPPPHRALFVLF